MLFHNVVCVCFLALLAPKIETNADLVSDTERPEALFADVIRNISRVNTELQNLINNYEQFKKSQSSQEKFDEKEVNYLSDPEGGRVNRNIGNQRVSSGTTLSYQTKMIFVGDESQESSQPEKNSEAEKSNQSENNNEAGMNSEAEKNSQSEPYSEAEKTQHNNEEEQSKEDPTRSMENTNEKTQKIQKATTEAKNAKEPTLERETENKKYIDIHNSIKTNKRKQIMPEPVVDQTFKEEKYGGKETQGKDSGSVSYAEGEHSVIEEEVASKLKNRASATDEDTTTPKVTVGIFLRSGTDTPNSSSPELTDNDVDLHKDVFKTNILREAYGDACLKLVIRKCYKACKSVLTVSCRAYNCKSDLKKFFITKTKTECSDAFNSSSATDETEVSFRRDGIINKGAVTHNEYISMTCQSEMPIRRMLQNDTPGPTTEQVNILRDKYERACQRISQKKCRKACNNAKEETCQIFECQKRLKRNFKRNCKANCKRAYSSKSKSSDKDSHSDSDSGSDDGSDDESSNDDDEDDSSKSKS